MVVAGDAGSTMVEAGTVSSHLGLDAVGAVAAVSFSVFLDEIRFLLVVVEIAAHLPAVDVSITVAELIIDLVVRVAASRSDGQTAAAIVKTESSTVDVLIAAEAEGVAAAFAPLAIAAAVEPRAAARARAIEWGARRDANQVCRPGRSWITVVEHAARPGRGRWARACP